MPSMPETEVVQGVVRAVVGWLDQMTQTSQSPRVNLRTDVIPREGEVALRTALGELAGPEREFVVRSSQATDAVQMRNRRGDSNGTTVYLVLWQEGNRAHAVNAESLRNLHRLDAATILGDSAYTFEGEAVIDRRIRSLAGATTAVGEHVATVWRLVKKVLRDQGAAVPLVSRIDTWVEYLLAVDAEAAPSLDALVERWGAALPALGLFKFPAVGRVLGVHADVAVNPDAEARRREKRWEAELRTELLMNQACTIDFTNLADRIAGRGDLKSHLEDLDRRGFRLAQQGPEVARRSFEEFCRSGDKDALGAAEWAWQDASRGAMQGVRGVLVQRRIASPRKDPFAFLQTETLALLRDTPLVEVISGQVAKFKQAPDYDSPLRRLLAALGDCSTEEASFTQVLDELAIGDVQACSQVLQKLIAEDPQLAVRAARLANLWAPKVAEQASVRHPRLLEGLMRVIANSVDENGFPPGKLILRPLGQLRRELNWNLDPVAMGVWLSQVIADERGDDGEGASAAGEEPKIRVQVTLVQKDGRSVLGEIELAGEDVLPPPEATTAHVGFGDDVHAQALRLTALMDSWQAYRAGWQTGRAPLTPAADVWVTAWSAQVAAAAKAAPAGKARLDLVQQRLLDIDDAVEAADEAGKYDVVEALEKEKRELRLERKDLLASAAVETGPTVDAETCRELLQVCTLRDDALAPTFIELTPHHPLCLRLRLARERLILKLLGELLGGEWSAEGNAELKRWAEDELGPDDLPVPLHAYTLTAHEPLLFDGWRPDGAARYQRADRAGEAELSRLGIAPVARVVRDYRQIFARAGRKAGKVGSVDRLQLQIGGDSDGAWAWAVVERLCQEPDGDIEFGLTHAPDLPARPARMEAAAYGHSELFAPRRDGRSARVQFGTRAIARPHMALDLGEHLGFQGTFRSIPSGDPPAATDEALLFSVPLLRLEGSALAVADPADRLCATTRMLMERVSNGQGSTYTYDFDPDQHANRLRAAQGGAHWLVLASRFPVHRAVQLAAQREEAQGRPFASLIDFWTTRDRGRPLYLSCSLHSGGDAFRDTALVAALAELALDLDLEVVLRAARAVAPKAAIALLRGQYRPEIQGILGLLLTAAFARGNTAGERVLALDQHTDLLAGGGQLADLIGARIEDGALILRVLEAKFSGRQLTPADALAQNGRAQISSTVARLKHFETRHPLAARTRRRLIDALADAAALAGTDGGNDALVAAALDPSVRVLVEPATAGTVHVWALDGVSGIDQSANGAPIVVHGRDETRAALAQLATR